VYKILRFHCYKLAQKVIVQTKSAASFFENHKNIEIIPNAIKNNKCLPDPLKPVTNIVSVGRLIKSKGFADLVNAFADVYKLYPEIKLTIYGEGDERSNLENLIESLKLESHVYLPGINTNINKVLELAELFVFPSHYEGFPNALCEAMAAGLPVIASDCSGNVDIVQDGINGRLCPVGDVKKLTELMCGLICNQEQRHVFSKNALNLSEQYNPENVYLMWDKVIKNALSA
jgi:glycosyltransferase involved in cell wall biosynthesis